MEKQKATYFKFQKNMDYPVYLRLECEKLEAALAEPMESLGFSKVEETDLKKIAIDQSTKVLKISEANYRVAKQINSFGNSLSSYGPESLNAQGGYQVYRYQNAGVMVFSESATSWELALVNPSSFQNEVKTILVRYLSWALGPQGVVGFWAVPVDEGFVVMKPAEAMYEAVFVDVKKMSLITQTGLKPIGTDLSVLRLDETLKNRTRVMGREGLLSYLSTNNTYFSYSGITPGMRQSLYELSSFARGLIYPSENFRPRRELPA